MLHDPEWIRAQAEHHEGCDRRPVGHSWESKKLDRGLEGFFWTNAGIGQQKHIRQFKTRCGRTDVEQMLLTFVLIVCL